MITIYSFLIYLNTMSKYYRLFTSPAGLKVLVGKNSIANDRITFRLAQKNDLWFHVKNKPGSHVILQSGDFSYQTNEQRILDIYFSAELAKHFSKAKNDYKSDIEYCEVKHVFKDLDCDDGEVLTSNTKIISIYK